MNVEQRTPEKSEVSQLEQALVSGPIGKTIMFYTLSSVVSLVVNGLYNIVDQIFIGQGIGYLGNSATNVIFPLTVFSAAVGILFCYLFELKAGARRARRCEKGCGEWYPGIYHNWDTAAHYFRALFGTY